MLMKVQRMMHVVRNELPVNGVLGRVLQRNRNNSVCAYIERILLGK